MPSPLAPVLSRITAPGAGALAVEVEDLTVAVNAAVTLERPLLVKGEPGTGKTVLAHEIAKAINAPLIEWNNHMGCVTATYVPGLQKYLMCITDGWRTAAKMTAAMMKVFGTEKARKPFPWACQATGPTRSGSTPGASASSPASCMASLEAASP